MAIVVSVSPPQNSDGVYRGWSECMAWCEKNCRGRWFYETEGVFLFDQDSDASWFLLRWGGE